jgi:hypothetical protein
VNGRRRGAAASLVALLLALGGAALPLRAEEGLSPAVAALLDKAKAGDAASQFRLASAYDTGRGAPRDGAAAMRWYRAAADQGYAEAQNSVGSGLQAEKRYAEALPWYEKAAAQNHALAINSLAYLYDLGLGVAQDRQRAFKLYAKAADLGEAQAMWNIANMLGAGQLGAPPDLAAACVWTLRAQRHADPRDAAIQAAMRRIVPYLERTLSTDQMSSCRQQADGWEPPLKSSRADPPR